MAIESFDRLRTFYGFRWQWRSFAERVGVFGWKRTAAADPAGFWKAASREIDDRLSALIGSNLSRGRSNGLVDRILIYRLGSLGDTIIALPCLHKVAQTFPDAERYVLTNAPVSSKAAPLASLLASSGLIDGVVSYPLRLRSLKQLLDLAITLRRRGARTLVYLAAPRSGRLLVYRDLVYFRLCGFTRFIGVPYTRDLFDCRKDAATGLVEQECVRLSRTLADLGSIDLDSKANWDLRLTEAELETGARTVRPLNGRPFIAVNMGGKAAENHWGVENWRRLFQDLAGTHGAYGILAVGVDEDAPDVEKVMKDWPGPVVNACGRLSPRESAAAIESARLFVGHDSGPLHLAAACGVPCVGLFSERNPPGVWHPYGRGHRVVHSMKGIAAIGVGEIANIVRQSLPALAAVNSVS